MIGKEDRLRFDEERDLGPISLFEIGWFQIARHMRRRYVQWLFASDTNYSILASQFGFNVPHCPWMNINTISRRRFVVGCVAAASASCPPRASGQTARRKDNKRVLRLVREFTNGAGLLAASPNGQKLCLGFVPGGPLWRLDVVQTGTWDVLYSNKFTANFGLNASFFASGEALYVNTVGPNKGFFIDLRSGEQ